MRLLRSDESNKSFDPPEDCRHTNSSNHSPRPRHETNSSCGLASWQLFTKDFLKMFNSEYLFCFIADFYDGCKMLMTMMTGRQAPSSRAAITALENIKLFRFKGFLLQVSGPRARPGTAALLCVILIMNTGLWLVSESVLGSWLAAQWHEYPWHNFHDLTSSSASVYLLSTKLSKLTKK